MTPDPIYLTQIIYLKDGQEKTFDEFETHALALLPKYHGKLVLRLRCKDTKIDGEWQEPYEVHVVQFESMNDFEDFKKDPGRVEFLPLKEASVSATWLMQGKLI